MGASSPDLWGREGSPSPPGLSGLGVSPGGRRLGTGRRRTDQAPPAKVVQLLVRPIPSRPPGQRDQASGAQHAGLVAAAPGVHPAVGAGGEAGAARRAGAGGGRDPSPCGPLRGPVSVSGVLAGAGRGGGGAGVGAASPFGRESHGGAEGVRAAFGLADVDLQAGHVGRGGPGGLTLRGRRVSQRPAGRRPPLPTGAPAPGVRGPGMRAAAAAPPVPTYPASSPPPSRRPGGAAPPRSWSSARRSLPEPTSFPSPAPATPRSSRPPASGATAQVAELKAPLRPELAQFPFHRRHSL